MLLSILYRVPLVVRLGGNPWEGRRDRIQGLKKEDNQWRKICVHYLQMFLDRIALWYANGYMVVAASLKDDIVERTGIDPRCVAVVHYPPKIIEMDDSRNYESESPLPKDKQVVLTVTNLNYHGKFQGVCRIIRDIEHILKKRDDVIYVIAGNGPYLEDLMEFIEENVSESGIRNRIHILGYVDNITAFYNKADIMAYISFIDAYPNVILEAQMAELPVVANADHGIVEQIEDTETGMLIDPSDENEFRETLEYLLDNPEERYRLGRNARQAVKRNNDPEIIGKCMRKSLKSICESTNLSTERRILGKVLSLLRLLH